MAKEHTGHDTSGREHRPAAAVASGNWQRAPRSSEIESSPAGSSRLQIQRRAIQALHHSPRVQTQRRAVEALHNSPRVHAQRNAFAQLQQAVQLQDAPGASPEAPATTGPMPTADMEIPQGPEGEKGEADDLITEPEDDGLMPAEGAAPLSPTQAYRGRATPAGDVGETVASSEVGPTGMPVALQAKMEQSFGTDFSAVRVHTGSPLATGLGALAATRGNEIHFAPGTYQPASAGGQELLGHELAHVVQQRAGRVPTVQAKEDEGTGISLNVDRSLEAEADHMGRLAARGERAVMPGGGMIGSEVVQPMLGFEIEMLMLIDSNGRPLPEKAAVGAIPPHLNITVDHGPAVAAPTPVSAADARYDVDSRTPGAAIEMRHTGAGPPEPRPAMQELDLATWNATTNPAAHAEFTRPASPIHPMVNNTSLGMIDQSVRLYQFEYKNWEPARAIAELDSIILNVQNWMTANANKPNRILHPHRRARWRNVRNALRALRVRAQAHRLFWTNPANVNPPANIRREYESVPGTWTQYRPRAGMGTDRYASIVEIVTNPYPPETAAGRTSILAAMIAAKNFADALQAATPNGANRVPLNTVAGAGGVAANIFVGNPLQPAQTTDGSIQATGAIDLAQFPSYVLSMTAQNPHDRNVLSNTAFNLKHHSDTEDTEGDRVRTELPLAVANATAAVNAIKGGAPTGMQNLRGLVVLICQYLRMGRQFYGHGGVTLDKNIVPFLSRTDLAQIYLRLVPTAEKNWLAGGGRMATLQAQILAQTNRAGGSNLFNNAAESNPAPVIPISCQTFVANVFNLGPNDGVTNLLGGFHKMPTEDVDPGGARGGDWISPVAHPRSGAPAAHREGFIFEMRNMASRLSGGIGRFPRDQWLRLAEQQVAVFSALNARTEASATQDRRVRHAGYGRLPGGPHRLDTEEHTDAAW